MGRASILARRAPGGLREADTFTPVSDRPAHYDTRRSVSAVRSDVCMVTRGLRVPRFECETSGQVAARPEWRPDPAGSREGNVLDMNRAWRRGGAVVGAGVLTAVLLPPAIGQAAAGNDDEVPVDQWPATDIFYDADGRPTIWPAHPDPPLPASPRRPTLVAEPDEIVVEDGVTQPVFSYEDAVREAVRVPSSVSSETGDALDMIYVDIIRPAATEQGLRVPTIIIPSPYYHANGRGRLAETKPAPSQPIDAFPLYYDNYFVPRGYAVALVDLAGTRGSTGCLDEGAAEVQGARKVVEWLAGDHVAYDLAGNEVAASWSNGLSGMTGKSWDGTVSMGVAATGVDGLATVVPIAGISSWYQWHFHNGLRFSGHTSFSLTNQIQGANSTMPGWQERCATVRAELAANQNNGDPDSAYWATRDWIRNADRVDASVFVVHGTNDYNVKPINFGEWWAELERYEVPRKIWLAPVAHEKAFDFRRDEWLVTVHRWYDHWLHGIDNGIMDEPIADVDHGVNDWAAYDNWPGGTRTALRLGPPTGPDDPRPGALALGARQLPTSQSFAWARRNFDTVAANGFDDDPRRLVFMTEELAEPVRISGETRVSLQITSAQPQATFSAYLVDYGTATRTDYTSGGGVGDLPTVSCFGEGIEADTGCYPDVRRNTRTRAHEVVARLGQRHARHRRGRARTRSAVPDPVGRHEHRLGLPGRSPDRDRDRRCGYRDPQYPQHPGQRHRRTPGRQLRLATGGGWHARDHPRDQVGGPR
jgi:X-Pro dipeptidyl-peptidase